MRSITHLAIYLRQIQSTDSAEEPVFSGLAYAGDVARLRVDAWGIQAKTDDEWSKRVWNRVYDEVKALGKEDFSKDPDSADNVRKLIPLNHPESIERYARIMADETVSSFRTSCPFLSRILGPETETPRSAVEADVKQWLASTPQKRYPHDRAVDVTVSRTREALAARTPRVVPTARFILVVLFFICQAVPLGIIGYAAWRDIREAV